MSVLRVPFFALSSFVVTLPTIVVLPSAAQVAAMTGS
jgi:hypothetical protein